MSPDPERPHEPNRSGDGSQQPKSISGTLASLTFSERALLLVNRASQGIPSDLAEAQLPFGFTVQAIKLAYTKVMSVLARSEAVGETFLQTSTDLMLRLAENPFEVSFADAGLRKLLPRLKPYPALEVRVLLELGDLQHVGAGRPFAATPFYERAFETLERMQQGLTECQQRSVAQLFDIYCELGLRERAEELLPRVERLLGSSARVKDLDQALTRAKSWLSPAERRVEPIEQQLDRGFSALERGDLRSAQQLLVSADSRADALLKSVPFRVTSRYEPRNPADVPSVVQLLIVRARATVGQAEAGVGGALERGDKYLEAAAQLLERYRPIAYGRRLRGVLQLQLTINTALDRLERATRLRWRLDQLSEGLDES